MPNINGKTAKSPPDHLPRMMPNRRRRFVLEKKTGAPLVARLLKVRDLA
jgi:hypothetical protein